MALALDDSTRLPTGWLEVHAQWLAGLWGLRATGEVKVMLGKIHIGVQHPAIAKGQVVAGQVVHAIVPSGIAPIVPTP